MRLNRILLTLILSCIIAANYSEALSYKCYACRLAAEGFRYGYERNATGVKIIEFANFICKTFTHHKPLICQGITSQFKAPFLYVLEKLLFAPDQLCGTLLADCGTPHNPFDANWTIPLPPRPHYRANSRFHDRIVPAGGHGDGGKDTFRVLQLSDLHFDLDYTPGAEARCDAPLCCQPESRKQPGNGSVPAGHWGSLAACDVPLWTIENMLQHINETEKLDYILLSGDYMSHKDWSYSKREHLAVLNRLAALMTKYFPTTPVFWGIGNHEGVPVNSFAPHFVPSEFGPQWLYEALYDVGKQWLSDSSKPSLIYRGSFAVKLTPYLKLISVNTGYCETTNFFLYLNQTDPDGTLNWLVKELFESEQKGHFVHILSHIPPGDGECLEGWARNYYRIVNRFSSTITAQFFGHIHWDSFTLFYKNMDDPFSQPTGVVYAAPSVTTFEALNPAYRIYTIQGNLPDSKHEVLDFETYFFNLTKSAKEVQPKWELLYSAKAEYGLADLSPESWQWLSQQIRTNVSVYKKFLKNYVRRDDFECDSNCRHEMLCAMRAAHHNREQLCSDVKASVNHIKTKLQAESTKPRQGVVNSLKSAFWSQLRSWVVDTVS